MSVRRLLLPVLRFVVAFSILWLLLERYLVSDILTAIESADILYVGAAFAVSVFFQFVVASRLRLVAQWQGIAVSTFRVFRIDLTAAFYGLIVPGKNVAAGVIRFYGLSKSARKGAQALAAIVFDRIFATISLCLTGIVFWLCDPEPQSRFAGLFMGAVLGVMLVVTILVLDKRTLRPVNRFFELVKLKVVSGWLEDLSETFEKYRTMPLALLGAVLMLSVLAHLLGVVIYAFLATSLGMETSVLTIGWVRSMVILITMVPISVSGLGVREGSFLVLLRAHGVEGELSIALSMLVFAVTILAVGILGGFLEIGRACRYVKGRPSE
jgi:uncharacterized protein (TIRG00374 family)